MLDLTRIIAGPICGRALAAYGADVMPGEFAEPSEHRQHHRHQPGSCPCSPTWTRRTAASRWAPAAQRACVRAGLPAWRHGGAGLRSAGRGADPAGHCLCITVGLWRARPLGQAPGLDWRRPRPASIMPRPRPPGATPTAAAHADPGPRFRLSDGLRRAGCARQATEGGQLAWRVLAQTAHGCAACIEGGLRPAHRCYLQTASGFGELVALRHAAQFSRTPARWTRRPSAGTHPTVGLPGLPSGPACLAAARSAQRLPAFHSRNARSVLATWCSGLVGVRIQHLPAGEIT